MSPSTIANQFLSLLETATNEALEAAITRVFSRFGLVFVKIRRDERPGGMPVAFCQYTVSLIIDALYDTQPLISA